MIEIRAITPVSACFELRNDAPYYAPQSYTICLNGEMVRSGDTNVFSVFSLRPGADYALKLCYADGSFEELAFTTKKGRFSSCILFVSSVLNQ